MCPRIGIFMLPICSMLEALLSFKNLCFCGIRVSALLPST